MSSVPRQQAQSKSPLTLGEVLYARTAPPVSEERWVRLVHAIAGGDQFALSTLYDMAHRLVFTLAMRITANRGLAEEVTLDVFHDIWRRAPQYDARNGTVLGWIMNQARSRALDRLRFENRKKRKGEANPTEEADATPDPCDFIEHNQQCEHLAHALTALTTDERQAIEMTYFASLTHAEAALRLGQPLGTVKTRIRSALNKLRERLEAGAS